MIYLKLIFVLVYIVCCTTADTDRSLLSSEFDFALSLLNKLPSDKSCIISPFSISLALSLVHSGTKGTSRKEIEQILLKGATNEEFSQHFSNIIANVSKEEKGVEFKLANRVFIKKEYILLNSYLSSIHNNYNADAVSLNFSDSIGSAATVNSFVNEVTHGKIKTIVNENIFDYGLIMLLVNAVYMKGEWAAKFNKHSTWPGTFYVSKTINKEVKYLLDSEVNRDYYENYQFQLLSLKYNDDRYRFNVFLPKEKFALGELQANLTGVNMEEYVSKLKMERLNIKLPKFNLESDVNLLLILKELGITGIFEGGKDLSGFTGYNALYVSGVIHKAIIEVDEDGTVAAAITAVFMFGYAPPLPQPKPIEFIADHPFMFCITFNNHPLFIGKYH